MIVKLLNCQKHYFKLNDFVICLKVAAGGRKSRLLLSMSNAAEFRDHLIEFTEFYQGLGE